jgi:PEP-CTERM motif
VFGFEAQPDLSAVEGMTATFFDASNNSLGSIQLDVSGNAGAVLFAASSTTPILSVELKNAAGDDFAIANVRFSPTPIPEPGTYVLLILGLLFLAGGKIRRRQSLMP